MFIKYSNKVKDCFNKIGKIFQIASKSNNKVFITTFESSEGIIYCSSKNLSILEGDAFSANNNDPYFLFRLPSGQINISIHIQILSKKMDCQSIMYICYDKIRHFSENESFLIGHADGKVYEKNIILEKPAYWLRIDPVDQEVDFSVFKLMISFMDENVLASKCEKTILYRDKPIKFSLSFLENNVKKGKWKSSNSIVFVTHELSGTGAPLLCREMSAKAKSLGYRVILISLSNNMNNNMIQYFSDACDMLLICKLSRDIEYIANELSQLAIKRVILNTVVSGSALACFSALGFKNVCLIHEMNSALKILHAEKWIKDYERYADTVVFPAECVYDEFVRFGGKVKGNLVIAPQGYYKGIKPTWDNKFRTKLLNKIAVPDSEKVRLIIGAGSVNFRKGVDLLPLIAKELQNLDEFEYHFLWLGTSTDEQFDIGLQDQIYRMNLTDRFHFIGYISDDIEYMNSIGACDVLALVSREDPYPSVMIESMVCEVPVVAFYGSGGAEELLDDGRGFLIEYMNIKMFAEAIHSICEKNIFVDSVKMNAKDYIAQRANFEKYVKSIIDLCK